jgi:hypothetical protein
MTKAELIKELEQYPDDWNIAGFDENGEAGMRYFLIGITQIENIEWVKDILNDVESKPSIVLKGLSHKLA